MINYKKIRKNKEKDAMQNSKAFREPKRNGEILVGE